MKNIIFTFLILILFSTKIYSITWTKCSLGIAQNNVISSFVEFNNNIFAGYYIKDTAGFGGGVYISTDKGLNWNKWNFKNKSISDLTLSRNNIFAGGDGIYYSSDSGSSWNNTSETYEFISSFATMNDTLIFYTTQTKEVKGSGIFSSNDNGMNWNYLGFQVTLHLCFSINGSDIFSGGDGVYITKDFGKTWKMLYTQGTIFSLLSYDSVIFAGSYEEGLLYSPDLGNTWAQTSLSDHYLTSIVKYKNILFTSSYTSGIYMSIDGGNTWQSINAGLEDLRIRRLAVIGHELYAGGIGNIYKIDLEALSVENSSEVSGNGFKASVFPNPVNDKAIVQIILEKPTFLYFVIYDVLGNKVKETFDNKTYEGIQTFEFNTKRINKGIYFVKINTINDSKTLKIIVEGK